MNKKVKNWLILALGVGIAGKALYDMYNDEEDGDVSIPQIEGKSKYANMEEVEIVENKEEK